jgi:hypothetical protein
MLVTKVTLIPHQNVLRFGKWKMVLCLLQSLVIEVRKCCTAHARAPLIEVSVAKLLLAVVL